MRNGAIDTIASALGSLCPHTCNKVILVLSRVASAFA
jgi:hypothetical protein